MSNQKPQPYDAVLGGQSQAPIDAAVLGGIEGVRQKLASDNEDAKMEGILQALNYGEKGIETLFKVLERESTEEIWWLAHQTLEKQDDPAIKAKLKNYFPWLWYEYKSVTVNRRGEIIKRTPGRARYYREDLGNGVYLDMVYIARGTFLMGAPASEHQSGDWERPQYRLTVSDLWIGKYPVTQAQWEVVMGDNPAWFKGANRPAERVSWNRCQEFCQKLSERTSKGYRLPSEAEWEYACRAGTITPFNCGETLTTNLANYDGNYTYADEGKGQYREGTVEVGSFPPNLWGLYDMHGNVWEWCEDGWHDSYRGAPANGSTWTDNHSQTPLRVLRGGSWCYDPANCRSASRGNEFRYNDDGADNGLRLVLSSSMT
jgi:formylglycine-generating enzyme required for sulfatase activity